MYNRKLKQLIIPNTVQSNGRVSFQEAETLTELKLPRNTKFTQIGALAFSKAKSLTKVEIPPAVTIVKANAFARSSLKKLILHEGLDSI